MLIRSVVGSMHIHGLALHHTYLIHWYWTLQLSELRTDHDLSAAITHIKEQLLFDPNNSLTANLCCACKQLWELRCNAAQKQQEYLAFLAEAADNSNYNEKKKLILHLKQAEQNQHCFKHIRQHMKPWSPGGLSKLIIDSTNDPTQQQPAG